MVVETTRMVDGSFGLVTTGKTQAQETMVLFQSILIVENATSAEELARLARHLGALVHNFRLD